jgi:hypothetical protein
MGGRRSGGNPGRRSYARYPRYPQVDCAWTGAFFMTASGCGRDDLPETEESLPSHSPGGSSGPCLRVMAGAETDGRAADEAAARRKLRACPLADAKAAGFVKRPRDPDRPTGTGGTHFGTGGFGRGNRLGRTPDLRVQDQPGRKRDFGSRAATGREAGFGLRIFRAGPGFGPGAAKRREPRASAHGPVRRNERASAFSIGPDAEPEASAEGTARAGNEASASTSAKRRTAGASAPVGEPAGKPERASARDGPRRRLGWDFGSGSSASKPPDANASPSRPGLTRRDSGGRQQCRPPLLFGVPRVRSPIPALPDPAS